MTTPASVPSPFLRLKSSPALVRVAVVGAGLLWRKPIQQLRPSAWLRGSPASWRCRRQNRSCQQTCPTARLATARSPRRSAGRGGGPGHPAVLHASQALAALGCRQVRAGQPMALTTTDARCWSRAPSRRDVHGRPPDALPRRGAAPARDDPGRDIGAVYYLYALRVNLGRPRQDETRCGAWAARHPRDSSCFSSIRCR